MSALWKDAQYSYKFYGSRGISVYPAEKIYEEIAFIAYYAHWTRDELMEMSHLERIRWCNEFSSINRRLSDEPENMFNI